MFITRYCEILEQINQETLDEHLDKAEEFIRKL